MTCFCNKCGRKRGICVCASCQGCALVCTFHILLQVVLSGLCPTLYVPHDHTQGHATDARTPLDEGSARRRDLYLTTQNIHNRQTSMPPAGFEYATPAGDQPQTLALDRSATGTGLLAYLSHLIVRLITCLDRLLMYYNPLTLLLVSVFSC
jgi:5-methylcytosine-specific restriction endonuclease McrA